MKFAIKKIAGGLGMKKKKFIVQDGKLYETEILEDDQIKKWTSEKIRGIKLGTKPYCDPDFKGECEFRGENRQCTWEGRCNQQKIDYRKNKLMVL